MKTLLCLLMVAMVGCGKPAPKKPALPVAYLDKCVGDGIADDTGCVEEVVGSLVAHRADLVIGGPDGVPLLECDVENDTAKNCKITPGHTLDEAMDTLYWVEKTKTERFVGIKISKECAQLKGKMVGKDCVLEKPLRYSHNRLEGHDVKQVLIPAPGKQP